MNNEKGEFIEVRSRKKRTPKGYKLYVSKKSLPEGGKKEDLIAAYKVAAKEEKGKHTKKFSPKALVPILLPLVLIGAVKGCTSENVKNAKMEVQTPKKIVQQINSEIYNVDSPYISMEGLVNAKGQEGMTANAIDGEKVLDGKYYNCDKQYSLETQASSGQVEFEKMQDEMNKNMEILTSSDANQFEKADAAKKALDINKKVQTIYKENLEFVEKQSEDFENSSKAFKDSNTDAEIKVVEATVNEYKNNLYLTDENVANLYQFVELNKEGYTINVGGEIDSRGDYQLTGDAVKEVDKEISGANAARYIIGNNNSKVDYKITRDDVKKVSKQVGMDSIAQKQFEEFKKYTKSPIQKNQSMEKGGKINER